MEPRKRLPNGNQPLQSPRCFCADSPGSNQAPPQRSPALLQSRKERREREEKRPSETWNSKMQNSTLRWTRPGGGGGPAMAPSPFLRRGHCPSLSQGHEECVALPIRTRTLNTATRQGVHEEGQEYTRGSHAQTTSGPQRCHVPPDREAPGRGTVTPLVLGLTPALVSNSSLPAEL